MTEYTKITIVEERISQSADGAFRLSESREVGPTLIFPSRESAMEAVRLMTDPFYSECGIGVFKRKMAKAEAVSVDMAPPEDPLAPIDDCRWMSNRTRNVLKRCGIKNLAELSSITRDRALKIRNLGKIGLRELEAEMIKRGLSFKEE